MDFLLVLLIIVLALTLCVAWRILHAAMPAILKRSLSVSRPIALHREPPTRDEQNSRRICRVSLAELLVVYATTDDLLVIDLRPDRERDSFPVPGDHILSVHPNKLAEVLEWLPANKSVVFCGASEVCITMIQTSRCIYVSAPLYVVRDSYPHLEVA